jgi:hypothetical protein
VMGGAVKGERSDKEAGAYTALLEPTGGIL